jgi:hypothetical protein
LACTRSNPPITGKNWIEGDKYACIFKREIGDLNIAQLFSEIPEAHTKVKMSVSTAMKWDLPLGW